MTPMHAIASAFGMLALALPALLLRRPGLRRTAWKSANWLAMFLVLVGAIAALLGDRAPERMNLQLSILPMLDFVIDPLRAFFLAISAAVYATAVAYICRDARERDPARERTLLLLATLLSAGMVAVPMSATVLSLVFTWELMSLSLWGLVTFDTRNTDSIRAGYLTLALSEAGTLAALAGLLVLAGATGSQDLSAIAAGAGAISRGVAWSGFLLTFFGFGVKTGILPVNVWIASGYSAAPRSLTPVFSGATMNLGIFTMLAVDGPLASHDVGLALVALLVGASTAILGIVYALVERNITRMLAQSSIENLGIVVAALGAGFAFAALDKPVPAGMALIAGIYHMLNHSAFKTLLFLGAGGIRDATGTDELDRLGGLMRRLPAFGAFFLVGTMAIAALPPLNGFVSEWLTLESLLRVVEVSSVPIRLGFALSGTALALTAGLALTCFTLLAASSLLGLARSPQSAEPGKVPASVTIPMGLLALACVALGILATAIIPLLGPLVAPLAGTDAGPQLVPAFFAHAPELPAGVFKDLGNIGARIGGGWLPLRGLVVLHSGGETTPVIFAMSTALSAAVIALILLVVWLLARVLRRKAIVTRAPLWGAGLPRLRPEMTYNATAFAAPVRVLFNSLLRPVVADRVESLGAFATGRVRETRIVHIVDRLTTRPMVNWIRRLAEWVAGMHHGHMTAYASYVVIVLVAAMLLTRLLL